MPLTKIEGRRPRSSAEVQAVIEAVYQAQREALKVPEWDRQIVERLGRVGIDASDITIVLHDIPLEDWGIRGGQAACDVDLGFKVDV
jgi:phenylpyruvate tautomerase PptA (4-oxalocrotonate tautomerase family)